MTKIEKRKFELVKSMDTIVRALNNEEAYYGMWIYLVPDEADDEDFREIVEDDILFASIARYFKGIMTGYIEDGIYIGGYKLY